MLTVPYKQFAKNILMQNADQIVNSHAENFTCSRSALGLEVGGDDEKVVTGEQSWWLHKYTQDSDQVPIA